MTLFLTNIHSGHNIEHSRGFSHRSKILHNANASSTVTFEPYNSKSNFMKNNFFVVF